MPIVRNGDQPSVTLSNARLVLLSEELSPEELSARIGLVADRAWRRGEVRSPSRIAVQKYHGWELDSGVVASSSIDRHLSALLGRVRPYARRLAAVLQEELGVDGRLWITHRIENWNPGVHLDPSALQEIAAMGVAVEIDVYCYEPGDLEAGGRAVQA